MLQTVRLENFKCFERLELNCAPLTLLCGLNGMGKSSLFQALLVLRQSFNSEELFRGRLILNGELTELGTGQDVLYEGAETDVVRFEFHHDGSPVLEGPDGPESPAPCRFSFDYSRTADELLIRIDDPLEGDPNFSLWDRIPPLGGYLVYVNAERIGPRKFYSLSAVLARQGALGLRGEHTLNFLHAQQDEILSEADPRCPDSHSGRVLDVIDYWLQAVTPGVHLQLGTVPDADAILAGFSFDRPGDVETRRYRATNVGFGLSYVLPVLAGLFAQPGTLCLIENPEAHLHPRGQTRLAELAVRASLAGVQVITETHSDHFIDGVRIAVRDALVRPEDIAIHYFERDGGKSVVTSPQVDSDGRLSSWPAGFFDQHEENLARLLAPKS